MVVAVGTFGDGLPIGALWLEPVTAGLYAPTVVGTDAPLPSPLPDDPAAIAGPAIARTAASAHAAIDDCFTR
jgi:hypothetical protein